MLADRKALEESHAPDHLDPPQGQEVAERDGAEEASEGARRAPRRGKADTRSQGAGDARSRSGQKQGHPDESEPQGKIQGTAHRLEGAPRLALDEQETHAKPEALGELHAPTHLDPPQCQEAAERNEAEEAPEGVKRANALRYTEYLGVANMKRRITRKILEGTGLRMIAPPPSSGEAYYEEREVTAENLLAATRELRDRHGRLFRATVALIVAVKEAEEGPWEPGSGLSEEALRRWLKEQVSRMEELKESLDQKR